MLAVPGSALLLHSLPRAKSASEGLHLSKGNWDYLQKSIMLLMVSRIDDAIAE